MINEDPVGDKPRIPAEDQVALYKFMADMFRKLRANKHKAHWSTVTEAFLIVRLAEEFAELADVLGKGTPQQIIDECADVANFAMMIADNERTKANKEE